MFLLPSCTTGGSAQHPVAARRACNLQFEI
jgi:hypothetical protein